MSQELKFIRVELETFNARFDYDLTSQKHSALTTAWGVALIFHKIKIVCARSNIEKKSKLRE